MINRWKISTRMHIQLVVLGACFALVLAWLYPVVRGNFIKNKQVKTRNLVEVAYGVADQYVKLAKSGAMSEADAQKAAMKMIGALRYEKSDYFWINDYEPRMIMHPMKPELDGKDLSSFADPAGKKLFVEFVNVAKKDGAGFVPYLWPKPGEKDPVPKISYVKAIPEWKWVIGSGIYIDDVRKELYSLGWTLFGVIAVILAGGLAFSWFVSRSVVGTLSDAVTGLEEGVNHMTGSSSGIASIAGALADGSSSAAASLEQTAASMEEMLAMTRQNAENAALAKQLADQMGGSVDKAKNSMVSMVTAMDQIAQRGAEIGKIIKTIDEIAFQTNLLALNAAVEAARAGEAGAGFAVVADEVRNLAQRAAGAAKNTADLIESTIQVVGAGNMLVEETNADFQGVEVSVRKVTELVGEISAATAEQARGITEVSSALGNMDKLTQQSAANASDMARSAEETLDYSHRTGDIVEDLAKLIHGADDHGNPIRKSSPAAIPPPAPAAPRRAAMSPPSGRAAAPALKTAAKKPVRKPAEESIPFDDDVSAF